MKCKFILIPILLILLISCGNNDDCENVLEGETFTILDSTEVYLSNYFSSQRVVFENSFTGDEIKLEIVNAIDTSFEYQTGVECPNNPELSSQLKGKSEIRHVQLESIALGVVISIQHRSALNIEQNTMSIEQIFFLEGELNELLQITSANSGLLVITPTENDELFAIKLDTLTLLNKEFYDVYEINILNTGFDDEFLNSDLNIKYTKNEGIIYIKDNVTNTELVFDRFE